MKIRSEKNHELWIRFNNGRQIQLGENTAIEVTDCGLLVVTHSDYPMTIYPPTARAQIKLVDPVAMAAAALFGNGLNVPVPSP